MTLSITRSSIGPALRESTRRRREGLRDQQAAQTGRAPRNDLSPPLVIVQWPIEKLHAPARDVRRQSSAQVQRVRTSYETFGLVAPALIRPNGQIINGVAQWKAAEALGLATLPCIVLDHLSEDEARTLRIALNRIGERGEWDIPALRDEVFELLPTEIPMEVTGFTIPELDTLLLEEDPDPALDALPPGDDDQPTVSKLGDAWRLGKHLVVCGDARDQALYGQMLKGELARFVFTDEPFNVQISGHVTSGDHAEFAMATGEMSRDQFGSFNKAWIEACLPHLVPGGLLATFIDWRSVELVMAVAREIGLELLNLVVWAKANGGQGGLWRSQHELLPIFKKPGAPHVNNIQLGRHGRYRTNLWQYPGASSFGSDARRGLADHPTVKPVALLEDALLDVTEPGDIVLEPFAGSGSTVMACERTGRRCRAIELEPRYVDLIVRRWQALTGKVAMHEETGQSFDEAAHEAADIEIVDPDDAENVEARDVQS